MSSVATIDRTAHAAWGPAGSHSGTLLATATAAQQLDAAFSTTGTLELFELRPEELAVVATVPIPIKLHSLAWGAFNDLSIIAGGVEGGGLHLWNANNIISNTGNIVLDKAEKHRSTINTLDFNYLQRNLLASGAAGSELYIWDLNNIQSPMTPGARPPQVAEVSCVRWNNQAASVFSSTSMDGVTSIWDLRSNRAVIHVHDPNGHSRTRTAAWHPDIPTIIATGSEDDARPVVQLWDLRNAYAPSKELQGHSSGILSLAWNRRDSGLLLSAGKDGRTICHAPDRGEVVCEFSQAAHWVFNTEWCPRDPSFALSTSFDGRVRITSILGASPVSTSSTAQTPQATSLITDPNDPFFGVGAPRPAAVHSAHSEQRVVVLKQPPKWLKRPCGVAFGFGGRLVSFRADSKEVKLNRVVSDNTLTAQAQKLRQSLQTGQQSQFCSDKIAEAGTEFEQKMWSFMQATFDQSPRQRLLHLLGLEPEEVKQAAAELLQSDHQAPAVVEQSEQVVEAGDAFDFAKTVSALPHVADAVGSKVVTQPYNITIGNDLSGLITKALLVGDFAVAVDLSFKSGRLAEALILAIAGGPDLLAKTQQRYFETQNSEIARLLSALASNNLAEVVHNVKLESWREILGMLCSYAGQQELFPLCELLGDRLVASRDPDHLQSAILCYIAAGALSKMTETWVSVYGEPVDPLAVEQLAEKIEIQRAGSASGAPLSAHASTTFSRYSHLLAAQGQVEAASHYLDAIASGANLSQEDAALRHRLFVIQHGHRAAASPNAPAFPFQRIDIPLPQPAPRFAVQQQATHAQQPLSSSPSWSKTKTFPQPTTNVYQQQQLLHQQQQQQTFPQQSTNHQPQQNPQQHPQSIFGSPAQQPSQPQLQQQQPQQPQQMSSLFGGSGHSTPFPAPVNPAAVPPISRGATPNAQNSSSHNSPAKGILWGAAAPAAPTQPAWGASAAPVSQPTATAWGTAPPQNTGVNFGSAPPTQQDWSQTNASKPPPPIRAAAPPPAADKRWNDPPPVQQKFTAPAPAPVAAPVLAPLPMMNNVPPSGYQQNQFGGQSPQQYNYGSPQQQQQQQQQQQYGTQAPVYGQPQAQYAPPPQVQAPPPAPTPEPELPIPDEHAPIIYSLNRSLEGLRAKNVNAKKLSDLQGRIKNLESMLRKQTLQPMLCEGLLALAGALDERDFGKAQVIQQQLASVGNMDQTSSWMVGVKTLISLCTTA